MHLLCHEIAEKIWTWTYLRFGLKNRDTLLTALSFCSQKNILTI